MSYKEIKSFEQECREKDAEIERLKTLLTRAADALAIEVDLQSPAHHVPLIAELRKAAS
jgi:hypothetical protein